MKTLKILVFCMGVILGWNLIPSEDNSRAICSNQAIVMHNNCLLQYKPGTCAKAYNKSLRYCDLIFKDH